jgi:hypothetical protein
VGIPRRRVNHQLRQLRAPGILDFGTL